MNNDDIERGIDILKQWRASNTVPAYKFIEVLEAIKEPEKKEEYYCPKCKTFLHTAPGIGEYCPNPTCDMLDDLQQTHIKEDDIVYVDMPPKKSYKMVMIPPEKHKAIREVYEKWKDKWEYRLGGTCATEMWNAIKKYCEEKK